MRFSLPARLWLASGALMVVAVGIVVVLVVARPQPAAASGTVNATVNRDKCGVGWTESAGGALHFEVTNTGVKPVDVVLEGANDSKIYGELEGIGTHGTAELDVVLGDGDYRFACAQADGDPHLGAVVTVAGSAHRDDLTPGVREVTINDLLAPTREYEAWIDARLPELGDAVRALDASVVQGDIATAKQRWLAAHSLYETLGAAYGAFGDLDGAINGAPASGSDALSDPELTGFQKAEALLWSGAPAAAIQPVTEQLVTDVASLTTEFADAHIDGIDMGLRAHEILENTIEGVLGGDGASPSGSELATIDANLAGTQEAFSVLEPLLASRYADLDKTEKALAADVTAVESYRGADGGWMPLSALSVTERRALDARLGATIELLAPVAAICDPRVVMP
jgi:iron uptake system component EfeO